MAGTKQREISGTQRKDDNVKMKKNVGLVSGLSFIVGSIIGSGIFISPKDVLVEAGSVGLSLVVWLTAGILAIIGSLSYSELGCLIPKSGGEYPYLMTGLGPIVAFLFAWTECIVLTPSRVAVCSLVFAEYAVTLFDFCGNPETLIKLIASLTILTLAITNCWDTKLAAHVQVFFTAAKLIALGIIIVGGIVWLCRGKVSTIQTGFAGSSTSASSVALAFYDASWAYEGWNTLNIVMEELQNPHKNLPRANMLGVTIVIVVYLLSNVSYLVVLGKEGLIQSSAVAFTWGKIVLGPAGIIMSFAVLFSTLGSANGALFSGSRILFAAAREHQFPEVLSYVNCRHYTPIPCIIMTTILALLLVTFGTKGQLINFFSFVAWSFYGLTVLTLVVLRRTMKDRYRPIKVFILLPLIFLVCSIYLVIAPIVNDPAIEFLYAFLFIIGGLMFYVPLVHFKVDRGCLQYVTRFLQFLMEAVPSRYQKDI